MNFLLEWVPNVGEGSECWDIPRKALRLPPSAIPVCLEGNQLGNPGLSPGTYWKGSSLSSQFLRVRLFLTSKFSGVTQEEEIT